MTSLTITLAPDIYERLCAVAQRQGKAEHEMAQELLVGQLLSATPEPAQPLYLALAPEVQALLATMTDTDMIVPPQGTPEDAIRLLQAWSEEDAAGVDEEEEGEGSWDDVLRSIDANRTSYRKLFPDLDKQP
jgi:hypothetical protein